MKPRYTIYSSKFYPVNTVTGAVDLSQGHDDYWTASATLDYVTYNAILSGRRIARDLANDPDLWTLEVTE